MTSAKAFGEEIRRELILHRQEVERLYLGQPRPALGWIPAPGVWSVAECLRHLVVTDEQYMDLMRESLLKAQGTRLQRSASPVRGGLLAGWFVRQVGPAGRRKVKAPAVFRPGLVDVPEEVPESFLASQDRLADLLEEAMQFDFNRVRVPSPVSGLFRFRLGDVFRVVCAHQRRHLDQAWRTWNDPRREEIPK